VMRIMEVTEAFGAGVFSILAEICNGLVEQCEVHIVYPMRPDTPMNYKALLDERIYLHEVPDLRDIYNPVSVIKNIRILRGLAKTIKPDVIHLHSSIFGFTGRIAFSGKKEKLFYTPHGYSFLIEKYSQSKKKLFWLLEKLCTIRNCITIACSESEYQKTLRLTQKAELVFNGIDVAKLNNAIEGFGRKDHHFTVYTLGRIGYQKNPELFNEIAERLPDVRFIWIGDGELKDKLSSRNIEVTGWLNPEDALEIAYNADIFVLTSRWEGLSVSLLESMYLSKVCIVSDAIGNNDVIHNGENGFLCKSADEYVTAIQSARGDDLSHIIGRAKRDIMDRYNTGVMINRYMEIYKRE